MKTIYICLYIRYLKMYEQPPFGRAAHICGRSVSHDSHHQALHQSVDGLYNHNVHPIVIFDVNLASKANDEKNIRQECEKESVPSLPISLAIVGELFGVVIDRTQQTQINNCNIAIIKQIVTSNITRALHVTSTLVIISHSQNIAII